MRHLTILNSKQVKKIKQALKEQFGFTEKLDRAFLKSNKGKIYLVSKDIAEIPYENLKIDSIGMYFAEEKPNFDIRLSIEGSQIVGPKATKRVVELNDSQFRKWFKGEDLDFETEEQGFYIIKHGNDFLGCGFACKGLLKNFVPKTRRIFNDL